MIDFDPPQTRAERHAMVSSQLRPNSVDDPRIVAAMASIPREAFLPAEAQVLAYRDRPIPLGGGRYANPPLATGRLLNAAELEAGDRVLLVGAAGGYAAAVIAGLVTSVLALEVDGALIDVARAALAAWPNVEVVAGPLSDGWAGGAPYDVLIVDGAVEQLPEALLMQVREGGRIVTGLVERGMTRLAVGRRVAGGSGLTRFADPECVTLPGFARPLAFHF